MNNLRGEVLKQFKALHKVGRYVFQGDERALTACRAKINEEFRTKKHIKDPEVIQELLKFSKEVETELKNTVIQAEEKSPGNFELKITPETTKLVNFPFREDAELPMFRKGKRCKK